MQALFSSPPSIPSDIIVNCITVLQVEIVSFKNHDATLVLNLVLSSHLGHPCIWPSPH